MVSGNGGFWFDMGKRAILDDDVGLVIVALPGVGMPGQRQVLPGHFEQW